MFCRGQGVLHIVYGSRVDERIQRYLQCFVALQDGPAAPAYGTFQKTKKNKLLEWYAVFWDHQDAVSEGLKPSLRLCSFKLCKKLFLKKKQGKAIITK